MRARTTILLGVVLVALVAAYMGTNIQKNRAAREAWAAKRLFEVGAADITSLTIAQRGADPVEAVHAEDGWQLAGPHNQIAANSPLLDQLASAVALMTNERPIADDAANLADFELDTPRLSVGIGMRDGAKHTIDFGGLDPTQRHRYAQLEDGGVFLMRAEFFSAFDRPLFDLRDRRIFSNLTEGLTRVDYERLPVETGDDTQLDENIQQATTAINETYAKNDAGEWRVVSPVDAFAMQKRMVLLERALQGIQGREYVDEYESLSDYGLAPPFARITAHGKDGTPQTLLLGSITPDAENAGIYVKRMDGHAVAVIDADFLNVLPSEPESFREKHLFTGEMEKVKTLRYRDSRGSFTLENDADKGWRLVEPEPAETNQPAVSLYLALIKRAEGNSFPQGDVVAEFGAPVVSLEFIYADARPSTTIEIGRLVPGSETNEIYARQDFGQITTISFEEFQSLQAEAFNFRVKTFFNFDPARAGELELTLDGVRYRFVQENGRWGVVEPAGKTLEAQSYVNGFLETLAQTAVSGVANPAPSVEVQGTDAPILEIIVKDAGTQSPMLGPIRVGNLKAAAVRDRFVSISGREGVYFVDQSLVDAARKCVSALSSR